jgi:hypothetical protein
MYDAGMRNESLEAMKVAAQAAKKSGSKHMMEKVTASLLWFAAGK